MAAKQINQTFEQSKQFIVGCGKPDTKGHIVAGSGKQATVPGVTAVSVRNLLPLQQANFLQLCFVVNDDDLPKETINASKVTNGHVLHAF